jgi:hypothetical protein
MMDRPSPRCTACAAALDPDAVIGHVGRVRAATQAAKTPGEFLAAAKEFGEATSASALPDLHHRHLHR